MSFDWQQPAVIDIETHGTPWDGTLLTVGVRHGNLSHVWRGDEIPKALWPAIAGREIPKVTASTYDQWWLKLHGHEVNGPYHDIQTMAWMLDENQLFDLDSLVPKYLGRDPDKRLKKKAGVLYFTDDDGVLWPMQYFADDVNGDEDEDGPSVPDDIWRQFKAYNLRDIDNEWDLYHVLKDKIEEHALDDLWHEKEIPFTEVMVNMECAGMPLNSKDAVRLRFQLDAERDRAEDHVYGEVGYEFNIGSGDQLAHVLFDRFWHQNDSIPINPEDYKKKHYDEYVNAGGDSSFSEWKLDGADAETPAGFGVTKVGREYAHGHWLRKGRGLYMPKQSPKKQRKSTSNRDLMVYCPNDAAVKAVLDYRKLDKVIGTYLDAYPRFTHDDRLYGRFRRVGTVTGRISSREPNLMNQPARGRLGKPIRALFQGDLIIGDHSQLEPRLMAHFSGDPVLTDVYKNNKDVYIVTAQEVFGREIKKGDDERDIAKVFFLALGYEAQAETLATTLALNGFPTTLDEAQDYLNELARVFDGLFEWKKDVKGFAKEHGYVQTIGGRVRHLRRQADSQFWKLDKRGERQAINSIIQGSAADILQDNMLMTAGIGHIKLLCQVHDELIWENTNSWRPQPILDVLQEKCENPRFDLRVPLKFEPTFCNSWAAKEGSEFDLEDFLEAA